MPLVLLILTAALAGDIRSGPEVVSPRGVVVSGSPEASQIGCQVLERGGNAVDAAVATAFALAVSLPEAGNIGGGGFMLVAPPGEEPTCFEYRETAPAAAAPDMFEPQESADTHRAVGVPGTVAGLALAHGRFGRLPWKELVEPAAQLAECGFRVPPRMAADLTAVARQAGSGSELARVYGPPTGAGWQAGDRLRLPDLARTLRRIAAQGPQEFYQGETAQRLVAEMQAGGGLITAEDLASYRAHERRPVHGTFRGYDVYGPPPPSSGGVCLVQALHVLEALDLRRRAAGSADALHLTIEALRRAFCDRARWLGDPDFVEIPGHLTSKQYAAQLAASIDPTRATPSDALAPELLDQPAGDSTTHFSVIDAAGMAVANTYTLEQAYGAKIVVRGAGFLLNNEMGDFNWRPGSTDRHGRIGTPPNVIAPGKRMLSSQTPVIVRREGQPVLVTGSPGGRTIISTVLCVVLARLEFQQNLPEAVAGPRLHHGWFPDVVRFEAGRDPRFRQVVAELRRRGHAVDDASGPQGEAHSIAVDPSSGSRHAVADPRGEGGASGQRP